MYSKRERERERGRERERERVRDVDVYTWYGNSQFRAFRKRTDRAAAASNARGCICCLPPAPGKSLPPRGKATPMELLRPRNSVGSGDKVYITIRKCVYIYIYI